MRGDGNMTDKKRKIVLFGIGYFERELLRAVAPRFEVIAVDMNEAVVQSLAEEFPSVRCITGDASSILTWKKIEADELVHVLSAIRDTDVNLEVCRIVREALQLDVPITFIAPALRDEQRLQKFNAALLNPVDIGINAVLNKLEKNYTKAGDIGLKKGEFIEVPILARSHLVGKSLNMLRPTKWHLAGLYRDNRLLIPKGDTQIKLKDRVVLFGDPVIVENIANRLLRGNPQFPLQFGAHIAFPLHRRLERATEELRYVYDTVKTQKLRGFPVGRKVPATATADLPEIETAPPVAGLEGLFARQDATGLYFLPYAGFSFFERRRLGRLLQLARKPVLLARQSFPYETIVVSLNCTEPATALELGIDLARLFRLPLDAIHVAMPEELRSGQDSDQIKERQRLIADFESIHKMKIHFYLLEGNPVRASLGYLKQRPKSLALLVYSANRRPSFFSPHVQLLTARRAGVSTLLIPVEAAYES